MAMSGQELNKVSMADGISFGIDTEEVIRDAIDDMFTYHPWDVYKTNHGDEVRKSLSAAVMVILRHVPPGPDRSSAIRKIREARMDANSAITHGGQY